MKNNDMSFPVLLLNKIKRYGETKKFKKGSYIFRDKFVTNNVFILLGGKASIYKLNASGGQRTIFIMDAITLLNEPVNENITSSVSCVAFEDCWVLSIDRGVFFDLMEGDFELTKIVIEQISHKVRRMYRQLKNTVSAAKVEKRLAAKLWKLCRDYGIQTESGTLINIEITSVNLADLLGVRRETVSRALKILQDEELILYNKRKFLIPNPNDLSKYFKGM